MRSYYTKAVGKMDIDCMKILIFFFFFFLTRFELCCSVLSEHTWFVPNSGQWFKQSVEAGHSLISELLVNFQSNVVERQDLNSSPRNTELYWSKP